MDISAKRNNKEMGQLSSGQKIEKIKKLRPSYSRNIDEIRKNRDGDTPLVVVMDERTSADSAFDLKQVSFSVGEDRDGSMVFLRFTKEVLNGYCTYRQVTQGVASRGKSPLEFQVWPRNAALYISSASDRGFKARLTTTILKAVDDRDTEFVFNSAHLGNMDDVYKGQLRTQIELLRNQLNSTQSTDPMPQKGNEMASQTLEPGCTDPSDDEEELKDAIFVQDRDGDIKMRNNETVAPKVEISDQDEDVKVQSKKAAAPEEKFFRVGPHRPAFSMAWSRPLALVKEREPGANASKIEHHPKQDYRYDDPRLADLKSEAAKEFNETKEREGGRCEWNFIPWALPIQRQFALRFMWLFAVNERRAGNELYMDFVKQYGQYACFVAEYEGRRRAGKT